MTQLSMGNVGVEFGATTLFEDVSFTVEAGERWGIIGRNGAGKTSLFRLLTGELQPTRGEIARSPGIRISLLEQHRDFPATRSTVWEAAAGQFAELLQLEQSLERAGASTCRRLQRAGARALRTRSGALRARRRATRSRRGSTPFCTDSASIPAVAREHASGSSQRWRAGPLGLGAPARQSRRRALAGRADESPRSRDDTLARGLPHARERDRAVDQPRPRVLVGRRRSRAPPRGRPSATPYVGGYASFVEQRTLARLTQQRQFDQQQTAHRRRTGLHRAQHRGTEQQAGERPPEASRGLPRLSAPLADADSMAVRFEVAERGGDRVITR